MIKKNIKVGDYVLIHNGFGNIPRSISVVTDIDKYISGTVIVSLHHNETKFRKWTSLNGNVNDTILKSDLIDWIKLLYE